MIHPDTELKYISREVGYGVVATRFIPAGTITWVLDKLDREFRPEEVRQLGTEYQSILDTYAYRNNQGNYVLCWDIARYINHSFNSNCLTTAYDFELAIRDIHPGEQLTDDYGYLNLDSPFRGVNEGTKRKVVYPDDLLRYHKVWDRKIGKVFGRILKLDQPLKPYIPADHWKNIESITEGRAAMESILNNYYPNGQIAKSTIRRTR